MMIQYPEYGRCTANIACSVLKHFGIAPPNPTYAPFDELLAEREYKNIVVLLLDGFGTEIMNRHTDKDGFFAKHFVCNLSSTFPPTTVASTTAILSGLYPSQTAWLGWVGYFPDMDRNIVYFRNRDNDDSSAVFSDNVAHRYLPYENIIGRINAEGGKAHFISRYTSEGGDIGGFGDICGRIESLCKKDGRKYIYAYCEEPDSTMHDYGNGCDITDRLIKGLEREVEELCGKLEDTLFIVTADHGHINIVNRTITDYPDICECLVRMPSIEARAVNMFVKPEKRGVFPGIFKAHFKGEFILYTKEEVLEMELFGTGTPHPKFESMIGDYLAVAVGDTALNTYTRTYKGNHAGMTPEEMTIPFIAITK